MVSTLSGWRFLLVTALFGSLSLADTTPDKTGFTDEEKKIIVDKHNELRRVPNASNMKYLEWNDTLAESAQAWANGCHNEHSPNADRKPMPPWRYVAESIRVVSATPDPAGIVEKWNKEAQFYDHTEMKCETGKQCGSYKQVIWANTDVIGCGVKYCPKLTSRGRVRSGFLVVCHYGPGGNIAYVAPYLKGEACSQCPPDATICIDGLCSKRSKEDIENEGKVADSMGDKPEQATEDIKNEGKDADSMRDKSEQVTVPNPDAADNPGSTAENKDRDAGQVLQSSALVIITSLILASLLTLTSQK